MNGLILAYEFSPLHLYKYVRYVCRYVNMYVCIYVCR